MDMAHLEGQLKAAEGSRIKLVATDGVFSMDGDVAPLKDILELTRRHGAYLFVDECHATGFLGPTGKGTDEYWGVTGQVDIINSTLGKALGGATGEDSTEGGKGRGLPVVDPMVLCGWHERFSTRLVHHL